MTRCQFAVGFLVISLSGCTAWKARPARTEIGAPSTPSVSPASEATKAERPSEAPKSAPAPAPPSTPASPAPQPGLTANRAPALTPSTGGSAAAITGSHKAIPASPTVNPAVQPAPGEKPSVPTLDLASLEQRLKDTHAIGVFTKLTLKNQVNDLLDQFRAFHQSSLKTPPETLRHQYEMLMLKVLSLLQNADPQLASAISSSREAIWNILVDPNQFAKI